MNNAETTRFKSFSHYCEQRALVSGTLPYSPTDLIIGMLDGGRLGKYVNIIRAPGSDAVVSVLGTALALPVGSVPGATGTASDSTASLAGESLTLKPWYSTIQVSMGAMMATGFAQNYRRAMERSFAASLDKGIVAGAGSAQDMLGVFTASASGIPVASDVNTLAAGAPKLTDLLNLGSAVLALGGDPEHTVIIVNPIFHRAALVENTAGTLGIQNELAMNGTLGGVKVIPSFYAPSATVAGSYTAVAVDLSTYILAVADLEPQVDEIKTVGSDNVTLQAFQYMNGKPSLGSLARRLKAV